MATTGGATTLKVLDLFSGIGGFSLGLERTGGFETRAFVEIDPYCRAVLRRHWPDVPVYDDVRTLTAARLAADGIIQLEACRTRFMANAGDNGRLEQNDRSMEGFAGSSCSQWSKQTKGIGYSGIDVICGGFPCQDISVAGKGAGIGGERSGLWSEYARIIGEVRPRYVIVENVAALLGRGIERVLGDLAALGYDAEWHCIPASAVGAPHRRDRVWIVAYPAGKRLERRPETGHQINAGDLRLFPAGQGQSVAHANQPRSQGWLGAELQQRAGEFVAGQARSQWDEQRWFAQSGMGRVSHGTANRVDRLRALGNAVVPQIPEIIGRAIMKRGSAPNA
jgi:DNA (cytosine-5)-methyltransferase 1